VEPMNNLTTVDGSSTSVCGPVRTTTCPAFLNASARTACSINSDCSAIAGDGYCGPTGQCTIQCRSDSECPKPLRCENGVQCNEPGMTSSP
jgi:hypothetical protein